MTNIITLDSPLITEANLFLKEYQRTYREHSVRAKYYALTQLIQFLIEEEIQEWDLCDDQVLRRYIITRAQKAVEGAKRKLRSSSLETQLASIRIFFQFLVERDQIPSNYARLVSSPKRAQRLPKVVDAELLGRILNRIPENEVEIRDLAILELLYSSGLRLAEVAALNLSHLQINEQIVRVVDGKGGKDRIVPVGSKAIEALENWLVTRAVWRKDVRDAENALFLSKQGTRLSERQISRRVKAYAEKSGVNINLHPHLLRHSMATHVLESSQDIRLVQELLGHADISTTQVYTHLNFDHLAKVFDGAHPRARRKKKEK